MNDQQPARRSRLVAGLLAILALAGLTAIASVAVAGKKLKTKTASTEIASGETGGATATCKGKQKAHSGGYRSQVDLDNPMTTELMVPYTSRRDTKKAWEVEALNAGGDGELTTEVYCRKANKIKAKTAEDTLEGSSSLADPVEGSVTARCPKKLKALSGGFENPDFTVGGTETRAAIAHVSRKVGGRKWRVDAANIGNESAKLFSQVVCHKGKGLKTKKATLEIDGSASPEQGSAVAKCKKSQRVISGGFASDHVVQGGSPLGVVIIHASHKEGKRKWRVSAVAANTATEIEVFAYCEKKKA